MQEYQLVVEAVVSIEAESPEEASQLVLDGLDISGVAVIGRSRGIDSVDIVSVESL